MSMIFHYGNKETNYLKSKDQKMAGVIEKVGHIDREINPDVFSSLIFNIIGQQISMAAQKTIYNKFLSLLNDITPQKVLKINENELRNCGISQRKVNYIKELSEKIINGEFNIEKLHSLPDNEAVKMLTKLNGVGVWTAEMILLFSLQRPNIFSYNDFGIRRGLAMIYGLEKVDRVTFDHYRNLFLPYGSVASLYLWEFSSKNDAL